VTGRYEGNFVDSLQFKPERFMENENRHRNFIQLFNFFIKE
jgi:hypothetical protein